MAITTVQLDKTACVLAALLLAVAAPAGEIASSDCVDNEPTSILSGGTNGVADVFGIDLDSDGDVDVLTASANDDKILWFESDGAAEPSFAENVISTNADGAVAVHAGDLDGDGDVDVVSASGNDNTIAWYENTGTGPSGFIERSISTDVPNASAVHIADIDGDGDNDVVATSSDDDSVSWFENDGGTTPTFTEVLVGSQALGAASVFAADLYLDPDPEEPADDDDLEILVASRLDDTVAWYERTIEEIVNEETMETLEFVVYVEHVIDSSADGATAVLATDIDGDGDTDVLSAGSKDGKLSWYENDGVDPPQFTKRVISILPDGANDVFATDLDGDGDADVIAASRIGGVVLWYENLDGDGNFGDAATNARTVTADAPGAAAVHAIDLDGDALPGSPDPDILVAASVAGSIAANDRVAWHANDAMLPPGFTERIVSAGAVAPEAVLAVDVDADTDVDIVFSNSVDGTIEWLASDGMNPPEFTRHLLADDAPLARDLHWADLDADLDMDLLVALAGFDSIVWYENLDGAGDFGDPASNRKDISTLNADGASAVFAIDLDDDGDLDVLSASADDDRVAWYENLDGAGDFGDPANNQIIITSTADGAQDVFAIDIDGDLDIDVLSVSSNDDRVVIWESDGMDDPSFTEVLVADFANGARTVTAADLDEDGDVDIIVGSAGDDTVAWFEQFEVEDPPDSGEFVTIYLDRFIWLSADFVRAVAVVDLDGDSDLDVISASSGDDTVAWYQSNLTELPEPDPENPDAIQPIPTFPDRGITTAAESVRTFDVADIDGDGALDVITGFLFEIVWHPGGAEEVCYGFDASGDLQVDGIELGLLGGGFGQVCVDPDDPAEWWNVVDYTGDCVIDGDDLAIMTSRGVWGASTDPDTDPDDPDARPVCAFTCP